MKLRAGSLKRYTKLINHQPNSLRKKETVQINKIINEREITTNTTGIQRIIKEYYEQLYANKSDNLKKMNKFLKSHNLPRLNKKEIESINRLIASNELKEK